jgi:type I restriction enzyme, S subunit
MEVEEIVGPIPHEWEYAPLGTVCQRGGGDVQTGPFGSQLHASDYVTSGIPSIMPQNIGDNRIIEKGIARIRPEDAKRLSRYLVRKGDIVYSRRGDVERRALVRDHEDGWLCGTGCLRVRLGEKGVDPRYASFYLGHPCVQEWVSRHAHGATMPNLNTSILAACPFVIPPPSAQSAIAHILGTLDDKIELNRRMNETLEAMVRALFKSWFIDFDPVRAKVEGRDPGLPKEIADLFLDRFEDSDLGEIPEGWKLDVLENHLAELEVGNRPKGGVSGFAKGVPSIGAESIVGLGLFDYSKTKYVPQEFYDALPRGHIKNRDVLLYKDGGRPGEFEPHVTMFGEGFPFSTCAINEHVYRLRAKPPAGQCYLFLWLSSDLAMDEMRVKGTGVAIPGLNSTQLKSLTFLVPPLELARAFDLIVECWIARVFANCRESHSLSILRDALLPKLISGEIRVTDAERFIGRTPI